MDHSLAGTANDPPPITIGGVPLANRLRGAAELSRALVAEFVDAVPAYHTLPAEEIHGDITRLTGSTLRLFERVLERGSPPTDAEMDDIRASAARRAEEGVPLASVLSAYHVGIRAGVRVALAEATACDVENVRAATELTLETLQAITATVAAAYLAERQAVEGQEQTARQALVSALLAGTDPDTVARNAGVRLAARYTVLAVAVAEHPDADSDGVDRRIVARRTVRRVRGELDLIPDRLYSLGLDGGIVLLPGELRPSQLEALVRRLNRVAGTAVTAAVTAAEPAGVADAGVRAREILDVVLSTGRAPGVYRLADVLLDFQLTRPGPARAELAAQLDPLVEHPELLATLEIHVACGLNRRRAASELHIHPNTIDYRMGRIAKLTGLDPTRPAQLRLLEAALVARKAERPEPS